MKHNRVTTSEIVSIVVILLMVYCTTVDGPATVPELDRGSSPLTYGTVDEFEAFQKDNRASQGKLDVSSVHSAPVTTPSPSDWYMAGANLERTSWIPEEVRGRLSPAWYRPIEPFISPKVQIITANDILYVSTARGLYALNADDGSTAWVYPTELPLGQSPTVINGVLYVGGYDRKIHAVEANPDPAALDTDPNTGYPINDQVLWTFDQAQAGFETNPLVVNGKLYAGNRDGHMYALDADTGNLLWKYETDGPILFSAAFKDDVIYFASNDAHAYALDAQSGGLVWKSAKLPGAGFHSWWPVVYRDWVIFAGSYNYVFDASLALPDGLSFEEQELRDVYTKQGVPEGEYVGPTGNEPGDWAVGTVTIDASRITDYFEDMPWRRTCFVLNRFTGDEFTFDSDADAKLEYAPALWSGSTKGGNRYPPVIGRDGVLYQHNNYISDQWIASGAVSGWKFGTQFISLISESISAIDELQAVSSGGNLVYYSHWESEAGAYDITIPYGSSNREWKYYQYDLSSIAPGYDSQYVDELVYGNLNGIYDGPQNPPIPYRGRVYWHVNNCVLAFGDSGGSPNRLPLAETVAVQDPSPVIPTDVLRQKLATEIQKVIDAGHLRPGYHGTGLGDLLMGHEMGYLVHYFHNPAETLYTLIRALPHLPPELQQQTREYLQREFVEYPPYKVAHIGWQEGAPREDYVTLPEVETRMAAYGPANGIWNSAWEFPQYSFYALWKYAQEFGGAEEIFDRIRNMLEQPPSDSYLADYPFVHNAYIAGYVGYLELQKLAGESESPAVRAELDRLLNLRATQFSKDNPFTGMNDYRRALNVARNFVYLVPELADYLHDNALYEVQEAVDEYNEIVPNWFVSKFDSSFSEARLHYLYDYPALFQAKALILKEPYEELVKYLDVPAFARGDLFYIQNLVAAIEALHPLEKTVSPTLGNWGTTITYTLSFFGTGNTLTLTDTLPAGVSTPGNFELRGTSVSPSYDSGQHRLTWSDTPAAGQEVAIHYTAVITTNNRQALVNVAKLTSLGGPPITATATVFSNPTQVYLPVVLRDD
jgi:outer membrane protein assembly factor BamB